MPVPPTAGCCVARICCLALLAWTLGSRPLSTTGPQDGGFPPLVLWAWERPEDLSFLDPDRVGVAILDRTIRLGETIEVYRRQQMLRVPSRTAIAAVVRIESDGAVVDEGRRAEIVRAVLDAARGRGVRALQIDFDAAASQRAFYTALLTDVRRGLPGWMPLGITALASWCAEPEWLDSLPVDEAVPMLFRMGPDAEAVRAQVQARRPFPARGCRGSIGVSTDEPNPGVSSRPRRTYVFHPRPWSAGALAAARRLAGVR
jgi:hypothetical protein